MNSISFTLKQYYIFTHKIKKISVLITLLSLSESTALFILSVYFESALLIAFASALFAVFRFIIILINIIRLNIIQFGDIFALLLPNRHKFDASKSLISSSMMFSFASIASIIYAKIDQTMIASMLSYKQLALYSLSVNAVSFLTIANSSIQSSIYSKLLSLYKQSFPSYKIRYQELTCLLFSLWLLLLTFSLFLYPLLVSFFYQGQYDQSIDSFVVLALGSVFMFTALPRSIHYSIANKPSVLFYSQLIAVFANILLNFFAIPLLGIVGAAYTTVLSQFLGLFILDLFFDSNRFESIPFNSQLRAFNPVVTTTSVVFFIKQFRNHISARS